MSQAHREGTAGRVLVIDHEAAVVDVLSGVLGGEGYRVEFVSDAASARSLLEDDPDWDAVMVEVMLPEEDGLEMLRWVRRRNPDLAVVVTTSNGSPENAVAAMRSGAFHYLKKPFKNDELRMLVAQAVQSTRLRMENKDLKKALSDRYKLEKIIGHSAPMQEVYRFIEQVAPSRSTVLIQGESGTGKELVAQAIHRRSPRAGKPFVVINGGSIPPDLLEDNLFGHVRGAFTGAATDKTGLLEAADGGTILFDEITSLAPAVQAKLLRVIQEKEFLPLGAVENRTSNVRIVAATNERIKKLVETGVFREDLYYRLDVISITLPPLRHRMEDLPLLVAHFLVRFSAENHKQVRLVAPEVLERLMAYDWPGNVRELENIIERGVVLAPGEEITLDLLPKDLLSVFPLPDGIGFYDAVSRFERQLIESALTRTGGVQRQAAQILGLKPTTLHEKMKRLGIHA